ncbi:MAG: short-chain dehydrogenase [Sulfobacillus benefaciens]|uniref:Short-chain dehydrogenase n=1 Tax=Sulfobacillus benefaciens TaxID=453960 RepID=A0A2T2WXS5_9FIRM|nr:MAG: short-chain dehydrogenase [Sulfobacillus benefaciens]
MVMKLDGKVAVITGSSMGIGLAIAERFLAEGARVTINSRSAAKAQEVARSIGSEEMAWGVGADVSHARDAERLVHETVDHFGRIDIMVCNAGTSFIRSAETIDTEDWDAVVNLNLNGVFYSAQAAAKKMIPQREGNILLIGSILGRVGLPRRAAYCATKHALVGLTKVLALDWAPYGIRVNDLAPGYIATEMNVRDQSTSDYTDEDILRRDPMGRYGTVEEIAEGALYLVSDASGYVTGIDLPIDGGWLSYGGW